MRHDVVRCSLNNWFGAYQTFEPTSEEVAACVRALAVKLDTRKGRKQQKPTSEPLIADGEFVSFKVPPSQNQNTENDVFKPFKAIADRLCTVDLDAETKASVDAQTNSPCAVEGVVAATTTSTDTPQATRRHSSAHWSYDSRPNSAIPGEQEGSTNRVDGYFHSREVKRKLWLGDVAVICEYKKKREDAVQNRLQLVSAASHLLNQDPIRFAVYGITIEDCDVSLWYFCRSHTAKSEPFNFLENPTILVRVFISFMFASSESLGFDSNIRRIMPSPADGHLSISYVYRFTGEDNGKERVHYYRTRRTICDSHRLCITGRATRVWEAEQVKSFDDLTRVDERVVVLREVWLDEGAATERQIQQSIFASLNEFGAKLEENPGYSPPHFVDFGADLEEEVRALFKEEQEGSFPPSAASARRMVYEKYFLTIREDFVGRATRSIAKDYQADSMLLRKVQHMRKTKSPTVPGADSSRNNQNSATVHVKRNDGPAPPPGNTPARQYRPKRAYRLVYEECCLDLDAKNLSLRDIFTGLQGCFIALVLLFCAGWVHRDISCGNVLIWTDTRGKKHGKLGDLEYAKPFPSEGGSPDPKTGTAYFMPVEIVLGRRLASNDTAQKRPHLSEPLTAKQKAQEEESRLLARSRNPGPQEKEDHLQHHFIHDLECLWWLSLWSITCKLGNWDQVKDVFVPFNAGNAGLARKEFLVDKGAPAFDALRTALPEPLQLVHIYLEVARTYFQSRFPELAQLDSTERRDPTGYSYAYSIFRKLVNATIPSDAPSVVWGSNPYWEVVSEGELKALEPEAPPKRARPDP
ncbi:hypothetical protein FA13DRAFT_1774689 [Coprinellus micaceus]|uniref:Fungal-type protein kinase domain-containing protein n=1 Tax=Coprinellus micaceus TaxID=71717 RepID=A0A4Y7T8Q2_COPMI|nr:hypothetical protein FA13DRAFT_1774689 [Coprinellus micaceus]